MKPTTNNQPAYRRGRQPTRLLARQATGPKGFTLLELLVSVFIFSLVMITVVALFARFVTFQKRSQGIQRNMEDARYVMELMAKTLRTSSVVSCNNFTNDPCLATENSVELYDYSQGKCIRYYFSGGKIKSSSAPVADKNSCISGAIPAIETDMVNNYIDNLTFRAIKTDAAASQVGRVTISVAVCSTDLCTGTENDRAQLETTVSLRDYSE